MSLQQLVTLEDKTFEELNSILENMSTFDRYRNNCYQWRIWGGARRRPPFAQFHAVFAKFGKIICWRPPRRAGAPSYGKSWIRPWLLPAKAQLYYFFEKLWTFS